MYVFYGGRVYKGELIVLDGRDYLYLGEIGIKIPLNQRLDLAA